MKLGTIAEDRISGFTGVLTARTEYANGCIKWCLAPKALDKDGKPAEPVWFDEQDLVPASKIKAGGPMPLAPKA